jgi:hypothetical protein
VGAKTNLGDEVKRRMAWYFGKSALAMSSFAVNDWIAENTMFDCSFSHTPSHTKACQRTTCVHVDTGREGRMNPRQTQGA